MPISKSGNMENTMKYTNLFKLLVLTLVMAGLSSCAMMNDRDYEDQMNEMNFSEPAFVPNQDFPVVSGDDGDFGNGLDVIMSRTPLSERERKADRYEESLKRELYAIEANLDESVQRDYMKHRDKLGSDSARIYFLSLSTPDKEQYLRVRGLVDEPTQSRQNYYASNERAIASLSSDIVVGMSKSEVAGAWGQPGKIDYAGDRREQNERWAYRRNDKVKFVYFDGGRVEGWIEE